MAPLPPRALSLRHPGWLTGLGGAARPWVRLLEETEAAQGWAGSLREAALVQRLAPGCS